MIITHGDKTTPKKKAQDMIMDALAVLNGEYWMANEDDMTRKEMKAVQAHIKKEADKIAEKFGFDESWSN